MKFFKLYNNRNKLRDPIPNKEQREMLLCIQNAVKELKIDEENFEYADNTDAVDYYIYKMKANQLRYESLIKKAKSMGILNHDNVPIYNTTKEWIYDIQKGS